MTRSDFFELPGECGPAWHNADDLLEAVVTFADHRGRFYGLPYLVRAFQWEHDEITTDLVAGWIAELIERGAVDIVDDGRNAYGPPFPMMHLVRRQQYERFKARPPIPAELRAEVYRRDGSRCLECGTDDDLTLDHIVPYSHGGPDTIDNLRTLCRSCNSRRGARV